MSKNHHRTTHYNRYHGDHRHAVEPRSGNHESDDVEATLANLLSELQSGERKAGRETARQPRIRSERTVTAMTAVLSSDNVQRARHPFETRPHVHIMDPLPFGGAIHKSQEDVETRRTRRIPVGEADNTKQVAFPVWSEGRGPKFAQQEKYDAEQATADWNNYVEKKKNAEMRHSKAREEHLPRPRPAFFGTTEVTTTATASIRLLNRTVRSLKNLQFCAGTLYPRAAGHVTALESILADVRDFNTMYTDMRQEAHAPGASRPSTAFARTAHPRKEEQDECECGCHDVRLSSSSVSIATTIEYTESSTFY